MRARILLFLLTLLLGLLPTVSFAEQPLITGAGATFPYPLYAKWAQQYESLYGVKINYQSIGSGGGIKQVKAKTVDFGASDKPLPSAELQKFNLVQFPTVMGAVVPVVNIEGISSGQLRLSGSVLADIFLGVIKNWNDPAIKQLNPNLNLPDQAITVVHRSDGSGTTFLFANYLSKVNPTWREKVGNDVAIAWPAGVGGKGNEGVAAYVQRIKGAIGYVEFAYAYQNHLNTVALQNQAGQFVTPSLATFKAAAEQGDWQNVSDFGVNLTNVPGANSWPIMGATFILIPATAEKPNNTKAVLQFFNWALHQGDAVATELQYVNLPENVKNLIAQTFKTRIKDKNGNAIW